MILQVVSANKGGVVALVEGLRGFIPFSQIFSVSYCSFQFTIKTLVSSDFKVIYKLYLKYNLDVFDRTS